MDKLFDTKDILTVATADQAVVGTNGYFCDGLHSLAIKIRQSDIGTLTSVNANIMVQVICSFCQQAKLRIKNQYIDL